MEELVVEHTWNTGMAISGVILAATFVGIFTEAVHGFHRTKFAMGGAGLMILVGQYFGFYNTELAIEAIDWNVVFLLVACLVLMWGSAIFSAAIDNIPFTAAMIPIILGMETQGVNVTPECRRRQQKSPADLLSCRPVPGTSPGNGY